MSRELSMLYGTFAANCESIRSVFKKKNREMQALCAVSFCRMGMVADREKLAEIKKYLKKHTAASSPFRGAAMIPIVCALSLEESPKGLFGRTAKAYEGLKENYSLTDYLPLAAFLLAERLTEEDYGQTAARAALISRRMRQKHPILAGGEDVIYAAALAAAGRDADEAVDSAEKAMTLLFAGFSKKSAVHSLAYTLTAGEGAVDERCGQILELASLLADRGLSYASPVELTALGTAAGGAVPLTLADEIVELETLLGRLKDFAGKGAEEKRRVIAALLARAGKGGEPLDGTMYWFTAAAFLTKLEAEQLRVCLAAAAAVTAAVGTVGAVRAKSGK